MSKRNRNRDRNREYCANRYRADKKAGICTCCRKRPAEYGKVACEICEVEHLARSKKSNDDRNIRRRARKVLVIQHYGGKCACCGLDFIDALVIDHVNGGGQKHRKETGRESIYTWLVANNFPSEGFQILCNNCNWVKHINGCCNIPHEKIA